MRIAHVISTPKGFGGAERVAISLIEGALGEGHESVLLNPFAIDPGASALGRAAPANSYRGHSLTSPLGLPGLRDWLRSELDTFRPDIVNAHLFHAAVLTASLPDFSPRVLTHHHGAVFQHLRRTSKKTLDRAVGKRFDHVIAVSSSVRRFLIDSYGYAVDEVTTIPNGWFGEPVNADPYDHPVAICAANFRAEKLHSVLLDAMSIVQTAVPRARLILLGDGPLRGELEDQVRRLELTEMVEFKGAVADVWRWYARANLAVMPSGYEPLGIAALEAMAAGLPVVATSVGGLPEIIVNGETGIIVPPGRADALAQAILKLVESPFIAERMGQAGRVRAHQFSMEKMLQAYLRLYEEVIRRHE